MGAESRTGEMAPVGWLRVIASDGEEVALLRCGVRTGGGRAPLAGGTGAPHRPAGGKGGSLPAISQVDRATWTAGRAFGRRGQGATCRPVASRTLRHGWQRIVLCLLPLAFWWRSEDVVRNKREPNLVR